MIYVAQQMNLDNKYDSSKKIGMSSDEVPICGCATSAHFGDV